MVLPRCILLIGLLAFVGCDDDEGPGIPVRLVPRDYPTPQAAVDAANPGDIVLIDPGVYTHTEVRFPDPVEFPNGLRAGLFMKDGVVVRGRGEPGEVVLQDTTAADSTYGVAFMFTSNETEVENILFRDFHIGAVVRGDDGVILANGFEGGAAGVWIFHADAPAIIGNLVEGAEFDGILNQYADAWIAANVVRGCAAGIGVEFPGSPLIEDNFLCRNSLVGTGANFGATPRYRYNMLTRNGVAGAMFALDAVPRVVENDIYDNPVGIFVDRYRNPLTEPIDASSNYWGTVDLSVIEGILIRDSADDSTAGAAVAYRPISPDSWNRTPFREADICGETLRPRARRELRAALRPLTEALARRLRVERPPRYATGPG